MAFCAEWPVPPSRKSRPFQGVARHNFDVACPIRSSLNFRRIGTTGASSSWVSFYFETGGEIPWVAAGNVASDSQGIQVLLSGLTPALIVCVVYLFESWIIAPYFCKLVDNFFGKVHSSFCCARRPPWLKSKLLSQYGPVDQEEFPEPR